MEQLIRKPTEVRQAFRARSRRHGRGLATVEMALLLPLLLIVTFAIIEYGWMFLKFQQITNAARQGARVGGPPQATSGDVTARVSTLMTDAGLQSSGYTTTVTPNNLSTLTPGLTFSVRVSVPYSAIGITHFSLLPTPTALQATVVMAREGP